MNQLLLKSSDFGMFQPVSHLSTPPRHTSRSGFTLVEFMIVTTVGVLLMLTASSVFLTVLVGRAKTATQQRLKAEGDYAMGQIEFLVRNAVELKPTVGNPNVMCSQTSDLNEVVIQSIDGGITRFTRQDNTAPTTDKIASISATTTTLLTSSSVDVVDGPNFRCLDNAASGNRYFTVNFTLAKNSIEQTFTTSVNMRNY